METITSDMLLCPCCQKGEPDPRLILGLNKLQINAGLQLTLHSACRCPIHNSMVGGAPLSKHLTGHAADITAPPLAPLELYLLAEQIPAFACGGIGLYPAAYIHLDTRLARTRWFRANGIDHPIQVFLSAHVNLP